jgi:Tfp pilus assembly protein PilO
MRKNRLLQAFLNKRAKDYSFMIVFFIIFTFFVLFVIRPNVKTVFVLQQELDNLKKLDSDYEKAIFNIVAIQSTLERNRDTFPVLTQAMPSNPQVNKVIDDIKKIASDSSMEMKRIDISEINLKGSDNKDKIKPYIVQIEATSNFVSVSRFLEGLMGQRRLKTIRQLSIVKEIKDSTASSALRIKLEIEGYYL